MSLNTRKLKRELKRPIDQLRAALLYPFELYWKYIHDRDFHANIQTTEGAQQVDHKVAIFLIYQPKKLAASTLETCAHLQRHGYAVLVISNAPLHDDAKQHLAPITWKIIERPNFGYDFGGYRDGIRIIQEADLTLDALVVLNDSIWWPVFDRDTTLTRMENAGQDLVGMIMRPFGKRHKATHLRSHHLQSYFYWFSGQAITSAAFLRFWDKYLVSSFKYNAIRRGELRLTEALQKGGLSAQALFHYKDFKAALSDKTTDDLTKVLEYGAYKTTEEMTKSDTLRNAPTKDENWRQDVFDFFDFVDANSEFHVSFQACCMNQLGLNHTKRSSGEPKGSPAHLARHNFLEAVQHGDLPPPIPQVLEEIQERHRVGAQAVGR